MKLIIVACAILAVAVAAPPVETKPVEYKPAEYKPIEVVSQEFERHPDGSYHRSLQLSNGVSIEETGEIKEVLNEENKPVNVLIVRGSYSVLDDQGYPHSITYTSDQYGYKAEGDLIPQNPPQQQE